MNGNVTNVLVFLSQLRLLVAALLLVGVVAAEDAHQVAREAAKAAREGDYAKAAALYGKAARLAPYATYAAQSRDMLAAAMRDGQVRVEQADSDGADDDLLDEPLTDIISEDELEETRRPLPPIQLTASPQKHDVQRQAPVRDLWEQTMKSYGLDVIFDEAVRDADRISFEIEGADYRQVIRMLELATNTVAYPVSESLMLIAPNDQNAQTRLEPTAAVAIHIPFALSMEDAQEIANALRQALEIKAMMVDGSRRLLLVRDRYSRVLLAQVLAQDLMNAPQDIVLELELREVNRRETNRYGLNWSTTAPVLLFTNWMNNTLNPVDGFSYLTFGGNPMVGIGLSSVEAVAFMSRNDARTVYRTETRTTAGKEAELKLGQQYPVVQQTFLRSGSQNTNTRSTFFPQVQFRQLGFALKCKPSVWRNSVMLDLKVTTELLTGQSVNDIPIFSNRETSTRVRMEIGETVAVAGLLSREEARGLSGLAGLSQLPGIGALFRQTTTSKDETELLILITPRLIHQRAIRGSTPTLYTGTATRVLAPL